VAASCSVLVTDDAAGEVARLKHTMALYLGGMGCAGAELPRRRVLPEWATRTRWPRSAALFLSGRREEAAAAVPDELVADTAIIGTAEQVRAGMARWQAAGVDMLIVAAGTPPSWRPSPPRPPRCGRPACQSVKLVLVLGWF